MKIGIVSPANTANPDVVAPLTAFAALAYPEVEIVFHPQCFESDGHFAGPDARRAAAFLEFANDPGFGAIWFARGGYGSNRILDIAMPQLNASAKNKKYVGYSDMGFLLGALYARRIGRVAHGPMPIDLMRRSGGGDATVARSLGWIARDERQGLEPGLGKRPAAAFNLAILGSLIGTPWLPDLTDHELLIEEVSEPLYNVDRLLFTMANATQLRGIAGVRLGAVSDIKENTPRWGETLDTMIRRWCKDMGVPFLGPAEIGHTQTNRVVPFGVA
ncbi:LD-carboxypeptidase [Sphingomonas radiodurans]|uniref:LD-carboxypeptidase n=1 Tax=Sphingomonas radiodurans TaxID=2890321 RepID=UPI001E39B1C3|nr:LD-carboxypeptidase [Sphingomonas radiodurans]WBH18062.1 LD-carboxypeptidase [Sphingomonas radiodurans]